MKRRITDSENHYLFAFETVDTEYMDTLSKQQRKTLIKNLTILRENAEAPPCPVHGVCANVRTIARERKLKKDHTMFYSVSSNTTGRTYPINENRDASGRWGGAELDARKKYIELFIELLRGSL